MDVEVDDRDTLDASGLQCAGSDRHVVQQAEAERVSRRRVMPRRSNERETAVSSGLDCGARGKHGRAVARLRSDRVELDLCRTIDGAQQVQQSPLVTTQHLFLARLSSLDEGREHLEQPTETRARFWMPERGMQLREQRVAEDFYCTLAASRSPSWFRPHARTSLAPPSQSGSASGI